MRNKLIDEFIKTNRGAKLPNDCIDKIKNILYKEYFYRSNQCVICKTDGLTYHEYLDGVGYICSGCLY